MQPLFEQSTLSLLLFWKNFVCMKLVDKDWLLANRFQLPHLYHKNALILHFEAESLLVIDYY